MNLKPSLKPLIFLGSFLFILECSLLWRTVSGLPPHEVFECLPDENTQVWRLASWNIQHLGRQRDPRRWRDIRDLARVAALFDFLAIQEVRHSDGMKRLHRAIEHLTREEWDYEISEFVGRRGGREKYAFLWRKQRMDLLLAGRIQFADKGYFFRPPYVATFSNSVFSFAAANFHIRYGRRRQERIAEILALPKSWDFMVKQLGQDQHQILFGDFNLAPEDPAWGELKEVARPLILKGASTLSTIEGHYANLYDNIWVQKNFSLDVCESGVVRYPQKLAVTHSYARRHLSDHAPVFMTVRTGNHEKLHH